MREPTVEYQDSTGNRMLGYLARPAAAVGAAPGVLVVPEAPGLGPMPKRRAQMLADLGFVALIVDLYGDGLFAGYGEKALELSGVMLTNPDLLLDRVASGLGALRNVAGVDARKLFAVGYCLGGKGVLELARSGADVGGVVAFHGMLSTGRTTRPGTIRSRILVCAGAADTIAPASDIEAFRDEMEAAQADYQITTYGRVGHAFTSTDVPAGSMPAALGTFGYDALADRRSWQAMLSFFGE